MTLRRIASTTAAIALTVAPLTLAVVAPALAQTPMDDPLDARDARRVDKMEKVVRELRSIVFQGRDSGKPVVVQPAETDFQIQQLSRRVDDLEQSLTRINGQLETTTYELSQSRRAMEAAQAENRALADRLTALEQHFGPADTTSTTDDRGPAAPPPLSPAESFDAARQLMLNGDYDASERAWAAFVDAYDNDAKAPEAHYWYGKTLSARGAHAEAAAAYIGAVRGWPSNSWAPDATVELARELIALKKPADACRTLDEFAKRYPKAVSTVKSRAAAARTQAKCG